MYEIVLFPNRTLYDGKPGANMSNLACIKQWHSQNSVPGGRRGLTFLLVDN